MNRLDEIRELYRYNAWASKRTFEATAPLSDEELTRDLQNSFPSIRDTLVHIVGAEWVWLQRWHGVSPTQLPNRDAALTHTQIVRWWQEIDDDRSAFIASLNEPSLERRVDYTNFSGKHFSLPLWQMLRHVVNHCTYHRGQVTTMLKQLGHKPVSTDLILLYQEQFLASELAR